MRKTLTFIDANNGLLRTIDVTGQESGIRISGLRLPDGKGNYKSSETYTEVVVRASSAHDSSYAFQAAVPHRMAVEALWHINAEFIGMDNANRAATLEIDFSKFCGSPVSAIEPCRDINEIVRIHKPQVLDLDRIK